MNKKIKDFLFILLGALILALGLNVFLVPMKLSAGGIGTIGTVLLYFFSIPLSITNLILNLLLFLIGFKVLGKGSIIKTIVGMISLSLFLEITSYLPMPELDIIIATICGGVLVGLGVGLIIRVGGSSGGSDFLGLMIRKRVPHISVATIILIIDLIIIIIAGICFKDFIVAFYSALCMYISSKVSDRIIDVGKEAKSIYITSQKNAEIKELILKNFERGVTEIYTQGGYSQSKRLMLLCVVSPKEAPHLVKEIKRLDKGAFIIISDARLVLGEGFITGDGVNN
ncbi:MAG: YitT family protein [Clostridia bacterium]|nr:YitT family protein [Clostridia bacterium]